MTALSPLSPRDTALLAVLQKTPTHGYHLSRLLQHNKAWGRGHNPSSVYAALQRLTRLGLLDKRTLLQKNAPAKQQFQLTPLGQQRLIQTPKQLRQRLRAQLDRHLKAYVTCRSALDQLQRLV